MGSRTATIFFLSIFGVGFSAVAQTAPSISISAVDTDKCELSRDPIRFDHKLVRLHTYLSRVFEESTLHDPACPDEALVNMGDPDTWLTEIWVDFADQNAVWERVQGYAPLVEDQQLNEFRQLLKERAKVHQMVAATIIGTFYAGKPDRRDGKQSTALRGYGHMGCCSLLLISRIESVDMQYEEDLNYSSGDWSVNLPEDCGSDRMLGLPSNSVIRSWQQDADEGRNDWHYDSRKTAEYELGQLRSGLYGQQSAGTISRVETKKSKKTESKAKPQKVSLPKETLFEISSSPYLKQYEWVEADEVTRYVIVVSRPYWLSKMVVSPAKVIWAPVGSSVLTCGSRYEYI